MFILDRFMPSNRSKNSQGFLEIKDCKLARSGILKYKAFELGLKDRDPTSTVVVYRSPDVLFAQDTLDSFMSQIVTNDHQGSINAENASFAQVGFSKDDIRQDNNFLVGSLIITDADAIEDIENGTEELSLGYSSDIDFTPGTSPDGTAFDAQMTSVSGNHIAIVDRGRNGSQCKIADSNKNNKGDSMKTFIHDGVSYEGTAQVAEVVAKLQTQVTDAQTASDTLVQDHAAEKATLIADSEKLQAQLDDAKSKLLSDEDVEKRVTERVKLVDSVNGIDADFDCSGKTEKEIKAGLVAKVKGVDVADKSEEYINARFEILLEDGASSETDPVFTKLGETKVITDSTKPLWQQKRDASMLANKEAWSN